MNLLREKLRAQGRHVLRCSDAPDMSGMNKAAEQNAEIAHEALAFYKDEYAKSAPDRKRASELAAQQSQLQNQLSQRQIEVADEERNRFRTTFRPIEERIAQEAMTYDTPARREAEAATAAADVERVVGAQRQASVRSLERRGALPTSGRVAAMSGMIDIGTAKAKAGAANAARKQVETVGAAKRADAAALGRGIVSGQATAAQLGIQAGNSAVANGTVPVAMAGQGAALMGQGFQTGIQGNASAGQLYGQAAQVESGIANANGQAMAGAGSAIGGIAMAI
jgi:hypothetical protein